MNDALFFSRNIVTRISHDLAGAVGAVSNGLELLEEGGQTDSETLDLVKSSAAILFARTLFFRAAYGNEGPLSGNEAAERILKGYLASLENKAAHFSCLWKVDAGLPLFFFRLILLAAQTIAEKMPKGGTLEITAEAGENKISVEAKADKLLMPENGLTVPSVQELMPKDVAAFCLFENLKERNWIARMAAENGQLSLVLEPAENK